jgi:hypothetical protein
MVVEDKDLLQADATVVAGILILLTIIHPRQETLKEKETLKLQIDAMIAAILPFAVSVANIAWTYPPDTHFSLTLTAIGFVYVIVAALIFVLPGLLVIKSSNVKSSSVDTKPSVHKITRYTSDGKPIDQ